MITIIDDEKLDYQDVLLVPQRSHITSRSEVDLETNEFNVPGIPLIAANMDSVGTFKMAEALAKHRIFTALIKHYSVEDLVRFYTDKANSDIIPFTIYSMGANQVDLEKFDQVLEGIQLGNDDLDAQSSPHIVCIDAANGYTTAFRDFVARFKAQNQSTIVIAGNVCTPDAVWSLATVGADLIKIGIGPGSVCTTRLVAGVGYPQFSAVLECAQAAFESPLERPCGVIADGGCTCPGDVVKAFAAGANAVMLGGMLAGHDEGLDNLSHNAYEVAVLGKDPLPPKGSKIPFHGMASKKAQVLHNGGVKDYRSSEGREVTVPYRGPVEGTIRHILGGLRSGMSYVGASDLYDLRDGAQFVKVRRQANEVFV